MYFAYGSRLITKWLIANTSGMPMVPTIANLISGSIVVPISRYCKKTMIGMCIR